MSSYDSFNRLGPNAHDDLKSCNNNPVATSPGSSAAAQRLHDPYRFTRSTAQPIKANNLEKGKSSEIPHKYR